MLLLLLLLVYTRVQNCTKPAAVQQVLLLPLCKAVGPLLLLWQPSQATVQPL
jgi:hypothetical protein